MRKAGKGCRLKNNSFVRSVIIPLQAAAGIVLLFGTAGAADLGYADQTQVIIQAAVSLLLLAGIAIYR